MSQPTTIYSPNPDQSAYVYYRTTIPFWEYDQVKWEVYNGASNQNFDIVEAALYLDVA